MTKIHDKNDLEEEMFISILYFQKFSLVSVLQSRNMLEAEHGGGNVFGSWKSGSRESDREISWTRHSSKGNAPSDLLPPVTPHLHALTTQFIWIVNKIKCINNPLNNNPIK